MPVWNIVVNLALGYTKLLRRYEVVGRPVKRWRKSVIKYGNCIGLNGIWDFLSLEDRDVLQLSNF